MANKDVVDNILFRILSEHGSVDKFLDAIFSFLYRRTDFFQIGKDDGFDNRLPCGVPQEIVKMVLEKYVQLEAEKQNPTTSEPVFVQECGEEIVETSEAESENLVPTAHKATADLLGNPVLKHNAALEKHKIDPASEEATNKKSADVERPYYDSHPECYNGARHDGYCWSQSLYDLDVQVDVQSCVQNGKQVRVNISHAYLKVEVSQDGEWKALLNGQLSRKIDTEVSTWTLDPGRSVNVHLEKTCEVFWEALLEGEPKINVRTIDCSKPYEDLHEEERAKIQEVVYDQQQKMLGKPTVKEEVVHKVLKEAWNKDDSPFKGQKFDPSIINVMG